VLTEVFGDTWRAYGDASGLHLAIQFPGHRFDAAFRQHCLQNGIDITPVEHHCIQSGDHLDKLLIGYGHLAPEEIRNGIQLLCCVMKQLG
jgi:GntR family transcriptional regulator/MocR family aminotransferase